MNFLEAKESCKVWVFAPFLETEDPTLKFYYDYTQSIAEYTKVFSELGCEWEWVNITVNNIDFEISRIKKHTPKLNIVLNLCDGDETNAVPGVSVIHALTTHNIPFTGADAYFFDITTSKITMKEAFDQFGVQTPKWVKLNGNINEKLFKNVGQSSIVKPAVTAGSMGLSIKNVVSNVDELKNVLVDIEKGFNGWNVDGAGLILEEFISGREFTTFLVGSCTNPENIQCYAPIERVFHSSLPEKEKFLSFDRLWETYKDESPMPDNGFFYEYAAVASDELSDALKKLSLSAFNAVKGMGYGRADIRMDMTTQQLYVLEINAQCGISEDEDYTSIGAILRYNKKTFTELIVELIDDALIRHNTI